LFSPDLLHRYNKFLAGAEPIVKFGWKFLAIACRLRADKSSTVVSTRCVKLSHYPVDKLAEQAKLAYPLDSD